MEWIKEFSPSPSLSPSSSSSSPSAYPWESRESDRTLIRLAISQTCLQHLHLKDYNCSLLTFSPPHHTHTHTLYFSRHLSLSSISPSLSWARLIIRRLLIEQLLFTSLSLFSFLAHVSRSCSTCDAVRSQLWYKCAVTFHLGEKNRRKRPSDLPSPSPPSLSLSLSLYFSLFLFLSSRWVFALVQAK